MTAPSPSVLNTPPPGALPMPFRSRKWNRVPLYGHLASRFSALRALVTGAASLAVAQLSLSGEESGGCFSKLFWKLEMRADATESGKRMSRASGKSAFLPEARPFLFHLDDDLAFCTSFFDVRQGLFGRFEWKDPIHDRDG